MASDGSELFSADGTLVIRNPVSGRRGSRERGAALEAALAERGYRTLRTGAPGDAGRLAREFGRAQPGGAIIVIGGDGTLFEAIEGLPPSLPLAIFPTGTVNLLARSLELPPDPDRWRALLGRGQVREVYFARCNGRPFTSVGSAGLDAVTVKNVSPGLKRSLQEVAYGLTALRRYASHRVPEYRVWLDGERCPERLVGAFFALGPYYGGPHRILPDAHPERRELDVGLLTGRSRRVLWKYLAGMLSGRLPRWSGVEYRKARRLRIEADPPIAVQLDGDYFTETPCEVAVEERPRRVLSALTQGAGDLPG